MMDNAAARPAADAWHPGPQCAGDGGGGKTENSTNEQQIQAHHSYNARPVKSLPRHATAANMKTLLAFAVIATVVGTGRVPGESLRSSFASCCRLAARLSYLVVSQHIYYVIVSQEKLVGKKLFLQ